MKRDETGSVTAFVVVFMVALLAVAGLVIDGGRILAARREAANVAESAARAGAQELDENSVRAAGTRRLAPGHARLAAEQYLERTGYEGSVRLDGETVVVTVTINRPLLILGIAGLADATVTSHGSARALRGITQEEP